MTKFFLAIVCLFAGPAMTAQSVVGTWQGKLPIPENPRIVLQIYKADEGSLRGGYYRVDKSAEGTPLSSVSLAASTLTVAQIYANLSFSGELSADGKSFSGTWKEGKNSYPVTFTLATPDTLWKYENGGAAQKPMSPTADPAFEVATIKPSSPDAKQKRYGLRTRQFTATNQTLQDLVRFAYKVRPRQIEGAPAWMDNIHFDIAAEPDTEGIPDEDQDRIMLRKLLAERFHLTTHTIQKIFPIYALTVERNPPLLTKSDLTLKGYRSSIFTKPTDDNQLQAEFVFSTMEDFANILMNFIKDRQVVDETNIKGLYDFTIKARMEVFTPAASDEEVANAFIHAVQAIGFKLVPKKGTLDVLIIDNVEQPSAN